MKNKGSKGIIVAVVACMTVIIVLLGVIVVLLVKGDSDSGTQKEKETRANVVITPDNVDEVIKKELFEYVEPGYFTACMNTEWHFSKGDAASEDAKVENLLENTHDIYFDVFLEGDETNPIYESPVIPRGSYLKNITLNKALDKGTYNCVMIYHLVDAEQNTVSTVRVAFKIIVES